MAITSYLVSQASRMLSNRDIKPIDTQSPGPTPNALPFHHRNGKPKSDSTNLRGDKLPILPTSILFVHRFIVMPAIMIGLVYFLRSTWPSYVEKDPMLDFVLSIVGIGPPAITLSAVAEMADLGSREDAQVSRMLMLSYLVTPFICVPVSASVYVIQQLGLARD
ncbi:unnamed protein product [Rhizoctonia solani]|uniref:Uncharacterized protein n=1 Tax=Rhizoctonia solani TaxID=456999 RepID=A0A8H3DXU6_9AGAM|nr:unnamed protein product [Rhizoctonia solani]